MDSIAHLMKFGVSFIQEEKKKQTKRTLMDEILISLGFLIVTFYFLLVATN